MITHPMIGDLSSKTLEELQETINNLNNKVAFMSRMHNQTMMNQLIMALNSYRSEYSKRQEEMWNKKSEQLKGKIDISNNP
jgi:hypothetical protein